MAEAAPHTILESFRVHQLLVFGALDCGKEVDNAGADEGGHGKVQFLDRGEDDSANDDWETEPCGLEGGFVVDKLTFGGLWPKLMEPALRAKTEAEWAPMKQKVTGSILIMSSKVTLGYSRASGASQRKVP